MYIYTVECQLPGLQLSKLSIHVGHNMRMATGKKKRVVRSIKDKLEVCCLSKKS